MSKFNFLIQMLVIMIKINSTYHLFLLSSLMWLLYTAYKAVTAESSKLTCSIKITLSRVQGFTWQTYAHKTLGNFEFFICNKLLCKPMGKSKFSQLFLTPMFSDIFRLFVKDSLTFFQSCYKPSKVRIDSREFRI